MEEATDNDWEDFIEHSNESQRNVWLKKKLTRVWSSPKFCGMCLDNRGQLNLVDMELVISRQRESKSLLDIMNYVFNEDIENIMSSSYICDNCTEKTIQSYLFIHNIKQLSKIICNCINDIDSKVTDIKEQVLESLDSQNANIMIILENDTEICEDIDDLTATTEIIPMDSPIIKNRIKIEQTEHNVKEGLENNTEMLNSMIKNRVENTPLVKIEGTPSITLENGKIVIRPIITASNPSTTPTYNIYKCNECPDIFTTYRSLKEHEKAKHKLQIFLCRLCHKSYNTQQYLNLHYKSHSKARCKICQMILGEEDLFAHLKQYHSQLVYACKFCSLVYYTQDALDTHFKSNHLINDMNSKSQCAMCLKEVVDSKNHKCKFGCPECFIMPCIHYRYLVSYRDQILKHMTKLNCIDCDYVTHRKEYLITHVNREHLDHHPFTCNDCGMQFYTKMSLKTHIDQYHVDNICEYCDTEFKKRNVLYEHRKTCKTITRALQCEKCVATFDKEEEAIKHIRLRHFNEGHACSLCSRRFLEEVQLEEHMVTAHSRIQYKKRRKNIECTLCNIKFNSIKELEQHGDSHGSDTIFPCKGCSKEFRNLKKLYVHQQRHYERISCDSCNKKVIASFYAQHAVRCPYKRSAELVHICEVCGKSFHSPSLLRLHQKSHERMECTLCKKKVKVQNMAKHMAGHDGTMARKVGTNYPKIECRECGHRVRKKCDLDAHINRFHLKVKPYICHFCSKSFCGKARLNEHLLTHTKENECFCSICSKKFANKVCLKMHMRIHTGENPYACDICGEKFRSSSIMKTHRLKKHLEKTVACPSCDNMFHIVREMRHHFKTVHWKKDKPFNFKEAVPKEYYHLFEDGRLPKVIPDVFEES